MPTFLIVKPSLGFRQKIEMKKAVASKIRFNKNRYLTSCDTRRYGQQSALSAL
ncbi:MAG: hypothetical protein ACP5G4_00960 [bacterium]